MRAERPDLCPIAVSNRSDRARRIQSVPLTGSVTIMMTRGLGDISLRVVHFVFVLLLSLRGQALQDGLNTSCRALRPIVRPNHATMHALAQKHMRAHGMHRGVAGPSRHATCERADLRRRVRTS